jgi:hypothetical protein
MNNTNIGTSLDDTKDLRKIILENPDLPLVIFAGEESYCGEYAYNLAEISSVEIKELTLDGEYYIEKEEFEEKLNDRLCDDYETNEELEKYVKERMESQEFVKTIVIYVG